MSGDRTTWWREGALLGLFLLLVGAAVVTVVLPEMRGRADEAVRADAPDGGR